MIPVQPQTEPPDFHLKVRRKGLDWLNRNGHPTSGPIPSGVTLPSYWRDSLKELHSVYEGICAYVCIYIHPVTGASTVEHYIAKSGDIGLAYEWDNYRLACGKMNSRKRDFSDVLDPFTMLDDTFYLDFSAGSIYPNPALTATAKQEADDTLKRLKLDDTECRTARIEYYNEYKAGNISSDYFRRMSPFVWKEANRQGLL